MKLGTETASVSNHLMSRGTIGQPNPEVGMGATILRWSDRDAATIMWVGVVTIRGQTVPAVGIQQDIAKRLIGCVSDGTARYGHEADNTAPVIGFAFVDGAWRQAERIMRAGKPTKSHKVVKGLYLRIGERNTYVDPSF